MEEDPRVREAKALAAALKEMGFKIIPSDIELHERYIKLARQRHPGLVLPPHLRGMDAVGSGLDKAKATPEELELIKEVNERMAALTNAKATIEKAKGVMPESYSKKDLQPYISRINKRLKTRLPQEILDITTKIISKGKMSDEDIKKYQAASVLITKQEEVLESIKGRQQDRVKKAIRRTFRSDEERMADYQRQKVDELLLSKSISMVKTRFLHIVKNIKFFKGKAHVKIGVVKTRKRKPYLKYILLTTSLIVAIIGGKYFYDALRKAYIRKPTLLLTGPKVNA
jgi:hypothetical protein